MKKFLFAIVLLSISHAPAVADSLKTEDETRAFADNVMKSIGNDDLKTAFNLIRPLMGISETEVDSILLQTKTVREQNKERFGKPFSYEFIDKTKAGQSLIRYQYIEKSEKVAFAWKFIFYKNKEGWIVIGFKWGDVEKELCWQ